MVYVQGQSCTWYTPKASAVALIPKDSKQPFGAGKSLKQSYTQLAEMWYFFF